MSDAPETGEVVQDARDTTPDQRIEQWQSILKLLAELPPESIRGMCLAVGVAKNQDSPAVAVSEFFIGEEELIKALHVAQHHTLVNLLGNSSEKSNTVH